MYVPSVNSATKCESSSSSSQSSSSTCTGSGDRQFINIKPNAVGSHGVRSKTNGSGGVGVGVQMRTFSPGGNVYGGKVRRGDSTGGSDGYGGTVRRVDSTAGSDGSSTSGSYVVEEGTAVMETCGTL